MAVVNYTWKGNCGITWYRQLVFQPFLFSCSSTRKIFSRLLNRHQIAHPWQHSPLWRMNYRREPGGHVPSWEIQCVPSGGRPVTHSEFRLSLPLVSLRKGDRPKAYTETVEPSQGNFVSLLSLFSKICFHFKYTGFHFSLFSIESYFCNFCT